MRLTILGAAFLLGAAVSAAEPPNLPAPDKAGGSSGYGTYDYRRLLGTRTVQKSLGLDADAARAVVEVGNETMKTFSEATKTKEFNALQNTDRVKKRIELREKCEADYLDGLRKNLTAEQLARLGQIRLQTDAPSSMLWPDVAGRLKLTDDQKTRVEKLGRVASADKLHVYQKEVSGTPSRETLLAVEAKQREIGQKATADAIALLDDAQKKAWKELTGDPFDLALLGVSGVGKE